MDTSCKGISWFGNLYHKFEDLCREAEEIMQQEVIEPAISQLETFNENFENLLSLSEPIGDALGQSSVDIEEGAASDSSLSQNANDAACVKSPAGTDEDCDKRSLDDAYRVHLSSVEFVKNVSCGLSLEETDALEISSQEIELDGGGNILIPASDDAGGCNSLVETEDRSGNHADMPSNISDDIQFSNAVNSVEAGKRSPAGIGSCPATDALEISSSCLTTDVTVSPPGGIELHKSFDESKSAVPLPVCDSFVESGSTMPFPESEELDNDVTKSVLQTSQSLNTLKLDKSCILVDGSGIQSISCQDAKCRSYKKKLKDAFASRMRLLKTRNHKQPADWSGDLDAGFDQKKGKSFTTIAVVEKSSSPDYEFSESEWEIV
ncbi:uncharacterized protein [Pyrus communis]|uniref:uncharacterized protein isoform X1 n=1 Tax=Pyrus communis TaxID=23211 RepID=UPI0035C0087F